MKDVIGDLVKIRDSDDVDSVNIKIYENGRLIDENGNRIEYEITN
jgi:hypothetical protein